VVVADGASESLLAGRWAKWLAEHVATASRATRSRSGFLTAYEGATASWVKEIERYVAEREERGLPIQWYEEPGLAKGSHSTIIAVDFLRTDVGGGSWRATALGDSCIFQIRDEQIRSSFPLDDPAAFSNQPPLLSSRGAAPAALLRRVRLLRSDSRSGDTFYVTTDALAAWFLRTGLAGGRPWEPLRDLGTEGFADFSTWVNGMRALGELRDDDTTLVRVDLY
jgi:hypothetical protein